MGRSRALWFGDDPPAAGPSSLLRRDLRAKAWHNITDGRPLKPARRSRGSLDWLLDENDSMPEWRTNHAVRNLCGATPTRCRLLRGRVAGPLGRQCRRGCQACKTAVHAVQVCPWTRQARCARHNAAVKLLSGYLRRKAYSVFVEPRFSLGSRGYCPDVVFARSGTAVVADLAVASGSSFFPMSAVYAAKMEKYNRPDLQAAVRTLLGLPADAPYTVLPLVFLWRGVLYHRSARGWFAAGLPRFLLGWTSRRVLDGTGFVWSAYCRRAPS